MPPSVLIWAQLHGGVLENHSKHPFIPLYPTLSCHRRTASRLWKVPAALTIADTPHFRPEMESQETLVIYRSEER